jgi:hypothetical protein
MSLCKVIDNAFDQKYLWDFYQNHVFNLGYKFKNIANQKTVPYGNVGSHKLMGNIIFSRSGINEIKIFDPKHTPAYFSLFSMLEGIIKQKFYLSEIHVNLQPYGVDGSCHSDAPEGSDDEYIIMVFPSMDWKPEWGGQFQMLEYYDNDAPVIEEYEYIPGRIVIIPAQHPHRGLSPLYKYAYRTSIAYRVTPNFEKHLPVANKYKISYNT